MPHESSLAVIVIGRNEGQRLIDCLDSLPRDTITCIYVDSGSTDGSVDAAKARGVHVVQLDLSTPFTAGRARNAGVQKLAELGLSPTYVQFVDGDCTLHKDWLASAASFLETHPKSAITCGRLREKHPDASVYNRMADAEWDAPTGNTKSCGGIFMARLSAFEQVGGFDARLIAGEEPELCIRLRQAGWEIWRLADDMGMHDIAITRFSQWWHRTRRGGIAAALGRDLHGAGPERHKVKETRRALLWGIALPVATLAGALFHPGFLVLLAAWPVQVLRLNRQGMPMYRAALLTLGKIPEGLGVLSFWWSKILGQQPGLVDYKSR